MQKRFDLVNVVLMLCALVVTGLVVRRELFSPRQPSLEPRKVADWQRFASPGTVMGQTGAPVQIIEFSDFQCPFCARVQTKLRELRERYPGRVTVVYRHFPLTEIHPHAVAAAVAAECAGEEGKFEPYHDALFNDQDAIGTRAWRSFAEEAGVRDLEAFDRCVREERHRGRVMADAKAGEELGVDGTPAIVVRDQMIVGTRAMTLLDQWVEQALKEGNRASR